MGGHSDIKSLILNPNTSLGAYTIKVGLVGDAPAMSLSPRYEVPSPSHDVPGPGTRVYGDKMESIESSISPYFATYQACQVNPK